MSKHCCTVGHQGKRIRVEAGFDRILNGYFMNIMEAEGTAEGFLYDSLSDPELMAVGGFPGDMERYKAVLHAMGISLPQVMLEEIEKDGRDGVGNRIVVYDESGKMLVEG